MSVERVRCPCLGTTGCKLCGGAGVYDYEVGPRGWMPFTCPTCDGTGTTPAAEGGEAAPCPTCRGERMVDPANPPPAPGAPGVLRKIWKIFMGG